MTVKSRNKIVNWKVIKDIKEDEVNLPNKDLKIGIKGFDFNHTPIVSGYKQSNYRNNMLNLLIHLWPGNWRDQLGC